MTVYNTIRPALLGIKDDGSVDILADDQGEPIAPTWAKDASGNVTGLVGPDGTLMMQFVDVGGSAVGTTVEV